ncbi:protein MIS12 homolog [Bicyclus anynana]|uniref:Protein MIS12 homolog n=1 Tax=Bicyclus anynana TaxID=110368 RepID=A0A6J1N2Z8_BICAN|nr:protein MIS12 homolog [Bicyclus anynana]
MINTEPWTGGTDEEYETQHFGFGTQKLKKSVREMVEQKIRSAFEDMESFLLESLELSDEDKLNINTACNKVMSMYFERAGPSLEVIDSEIDSLMRVPPNVLLPVDEVQLEQTTEEEYKKLQDEVADLKRRHERCCLMLKFLNDKLEELSSLDEVVELAKKDMKVTDLVEKDLEERAKVNHKKLLKRVNRLKATVIKTPED